MKELGQAAVGEAARATDGARSPHPPDPGSSSKKPAASFQDKIQETMERMQASGEQATAAAASEDADDILAEMLEHMRQGGDDDETGPGNDEEFSNLLMGMMEQLTNKEILYEPMKELHQKFPAWMRTNRDQVSDDDRRRYDEQQVLVAEIVAKFEQPDYSDDNAAHREYIVERMQKVWTSSLFFFPSLFEMIIPPPASPLATPPELLILCFFLGRCKPPDPHHRISSVT